MKLFLKIISITGLLFINNLEAGFLSDSVNGEIDKYKEYGKEKVKEYSIEKSKDFGGGLILDNSELGSWWANNSTYVTGLIDFCYESASSKSTVNGNICSTVDNVDVDVCKFLPSKLGSRKKLSKEERGRKIIPLRQWCNTLKDAAINLITNEANKRMGISGSSKNDVKDSEFNSKEQNKKENRISNALSQYKKQIKAENNTYSEKVISLEKQGKGYVIRNEISKLAKNTEDLSKESLDKLDDKVIFNSHKEYLDDLNSKANMDYEVYKKLFNFNSHVQSAQEQFTSFNKQKKSYQEKIDFIENYIESEKDGMRGLYYKWAEQKAEEEIMYELPKKLDTYYAIFNEKSLLSNSKYSGLSKKIQVALINNDITTQQFYEKEVMLKWKKIADERADDLKNLLIKNAIASEQFDREAALKRISTLIN